MLNQSITEIYSHRGTATSGTWDYNRLWEELVNLHSLTEKLTLQITVLNDSSADIDRGITAQLEAIQNQVSVLLSCRL